MTYALLSEVWPDMEIKKNEKKKKKKKSSNIQPLTQDEMETELLDNKSIDSYTKRKLRGMKVSPYMNEEIQFQNIKKNEYSNFNENIVRPDINQKTIKNRVPYENDSDYLEFLNFKKNKQSSTLNNQFDEQFNELLLYIFTGFFLLMIYDNIYKLGKESI